MAESLAAVAVAVEIVVADQDHVVGFGLRLDTYRDRDSGQCDDE